MEELRIDKQDMIDPFEGAKPLCDLSTPERQQHMEGLPWVDLLGVDAWPKQTILTIRDMSRRTGLRLMPRVVHT